MSLQANIEALLLSSQRKVVETVFPPERASAGVRIARYWAEGAAERAAAGAGVYPRGHAAAAPPPFLNERALVGRQLRAVFASLFRELRTLLEVLPLHISLVQGKLTRQKEHYNRSLKRTLSAVTSFLTAQCCAVSRGRCCCGCGAASCCTKCPNSMWDPYAMPLPCTQFDFLDLYEGDNLKEDSVYRDIQAHCDMETSVLRNRMSEQVVVRDAKIRYLKQQLESACDAAGAPLPQNINEAARSSVQGRNDRHRRLSRYAERDKATPKCLNAATNTDAVWVCSCDDPTEQTELLTHLQGPLQIAASPAMHPKAASFQRIESKARRKRPKPKAPRQSGSKVSVQSGLSSMLTKMSLVGKLRPKGNRKKRGGSSGSGPRESLAGSLASFPDSVDSIGASEAATPTLTEHTETIARNPSQSLCETVFEPEENDPTAELDDVIASIKALSVQVTNTVVEAEDDVKESEEEDPTPSQGDTHTHTPYEDPNATEPLSEDPPVTPSVPPPFPESVPILHPGDGSRTELPPPELQQTTEAKPTKRLKKLATAVVATKPGPSTPRTQPPSSPQAAPAEEGGEEENTEAVDPPPPLENEGEVIHVNERVRLHIREVQKPVLRPHICVSIGENKESIEDPYPCTNLKQDWPFRSSPHHVATFSQMKVNIPPPPPPLPPPAVPPTATEKTPKSPSFSTFRSSSLSSLPPPLEPEKEEAAQMYDRVLALAKGRQPVSKPKKVEGKKFDPGRTNSCKFYPADLDVSQYIADPRKPVDTSPKMNNLTRASNNLLAGNLLMGVSDVYGVQSFTLSRAARKPVAKIYKVNGKHSATSNADQTLENIVPETMFEN